MTKSSVPRTSQFYFYLMPDETQAFVRAIQDRGYMIYCPRSTRPAPSTPGGDLLSQIFIAPDASTLVVMNKASEGVYFVDPAVSPVVELDCPLLRDSSLSSGRLYFRGGYDGRDGWVSFPPSVFQVYEELKTYLKDTFLTGQQYLGGYVSNETISFRAKGGRLVQI